MNCILGISGKAGAGKDTLASMILYIDKVGVAKANYRQWFANNKIVPEPNINLYHFGDYLKKVCSIIYNIPIEYFHSRLYKDSYWYCINEHTFYNDDSADRYYKVTIDMLENNNLAYYINKFKVVIKLRTLLQYFGTNVCRQNLGDNIWVDSCMSSINNYDSIKCIADVRFKSEVDAINNLANSYIIRIVRDSVNSESKHISENDNLYYDIRIENNQTLMSLFYKAIELVNKINNKEL